MPGRFLFEKLPKYPHLREEEIKIWERFINKYPGFFDSVDYDVHVGKSREFPGQPVDKITEAMKELSRKRVDFIGYKNVEVFIGEIKPNALLEAFGQLIGEKDLYLKEHSEIKSASMILLTDKENPDMVDLSFNYGIIFFVV